MVLIENKVGASAGDGQLERYKAALAARYPHHRRLMVFLTPNGDEPDCEGFVAFSYQNLARVLEQLAAETSTPSEASLILTYHHWRIFTQGAEGVCVIFDRAKLEAALTAAGDLRFGAVEYKWIYELKQADPAKLKDFAFIKRRGFKAEAEWRMIHNWRAAAGEAAPKTHTVSIPADCIARIVINPWMPTPLFESVRSVLKQIQTRRVAAPVLPSRLTNSSQWQGAAAGLLKRYM